LTNINLSDEYGRILINFTHFPLSHGPIMKKYPLVVIQMACLFFTGCFGISDIDRTQPNKIQKSVFSGEWFFTQTVIGAPYSTAFTFIGEQPDRSERIRWDIQETFLIAHRSYDLIANTDRESDLPGDHVENTPIAIFPILSHFDVQREYNASTGEQTNVLVENGTDQPWYDRAYMRVDWSQNLAANFNFLADQVSQTPGSHYVQKPSDPNSLLLAVKDENRWSNHQGDSIASLSSADYLDVVHRIFATPETFYVEDWDGTIYEEPACWYYTNSDCYSAEITIRSSFLKVDPNNTYEPKDYPDNEIVRDENGDPVRVWWTGEDNMTLGPDPEGFIARAPYFDRFGYFRTERERYDRRYEETHTGRIFLINRFNIWENGAACQDADSATPFADCTVKPIVYHLSRGFPTELISDAEEVVEEWNRSFQETVRALKYGDNRSLSDVEDVVILKRNSFTVDSDGTVVNRGQRIGDLRYNMIVWVDHANLAGLLGYGPMAADPLTGEILHANAFIYGAGVDSYAQHGKTIIDLINDPSRAQEYMDGLDVSTEVFLRAASDPHPKQKTLNFLQKKFQNNRNKEIRKAGLQALRHDGGGNRARLEALRDTPLESRLMTDEILRVFGGAQDPTQGSPTAAQRAKASPANWSTGQAFKKEKHRRTHLSKHNIMHTRAFDTSIVGLAESLKDLPSEEIFQTLRKAVFQATALHEIGHNLGLRHNFEGSTDALNYGIEYWDLKGEGAVAMETLDQEQIDGHMREHQYSSIMDYGSRFSSDLQGLGLYDKAAIAFGYGDLVNVFDNGEPDEPLLEAYDLDTIFRDWRHYTKLPSILGGVEEMHERSLKPYSQIVDQLAGRARWDLWEVPFRFCSDEYDGFTSTCASFDEGADAYEIANSARTQYIEYFPLLSFQRDRRYFSEWDYMATVWWRTFQPMLTQYQNWIYDSYFLDYEWEDFRINYDLDYYRIEDVPWAEADDGGLDGAAATRLLIDTISDTLARPEPGSYSYDPLEEVMLLYSYGEETDAAFYLPLGEGRYTDSIWDVDAGYYFYDRLVMVGSFYDKLIALEAAVASDTYFLGVDTGAEVDRYAIGLSLMFPEDVYKIVGGVASEDYPVFAGAACDADGRYDPPHFTDTDVRCEGEGFQLVDPATSFTVELFAIYYGMAFLPGAFDLAFNDRMKIWLEGSGEAIAVADPNLLVRFENPLNNRVYLATRLEDASAYCPGAALLERAQRFADAYTADPSTYNRYLLDALVSTIEDVRGTYDIFGTFYF
jgi:hypothetical protein